MDPRGASSSSSSSSEKYDVFLSFRGEDTRNNFTSHLYYALDRKKIKTYIDEESLERGEEISPALLAAIQKSKISVIVFSKYYASSSWCLNELVRILECHRENEQMVIPIFYEVDPSHIRKQEGSVGEAFLKHEERFRGNLDIVQKWRDALTELADISGWDSRVTRPDSKLVDEVVSDVLKKLSGTALLSTDGFENLVGMEKRVQEVESLLSIGSPNVRMIGLWGMGGIGKTTLANAVYSRINSRFERSCFLENVSEESEKHGGLEKLRNKLVAELLDEQNVNLRMSSTSSVIIERRLKRTRVLIVLDDVSKSEQLDNLIGVGKLFASESRILLTTRNQNVLTTSKAEIEKRVYEVEKLNSDEALDLFNLTVFREGNLSSSDYTEQSKKMVCYTGGNPLAIEVLGKNVRSLAEPSNVKWEKTLERFKKSPPDDIQKVLKISYDGLEKDEKNVFLDIACFFKGMRKAFVENILDDKFSASIVIDILCQKSLITINSHYKVLEMHDLVQKMGREIVFQESERKGERSRLWIAEDIFHVLENNQGIEKIQGIFLDLSDIDEEMHLEPTILKRMHNLRLFKIYYSSDVKKGKVYLRELKCLPRSLSYLEWQEYPLNYFPSKFKTENLVELKFPYSELTQLWDGVQDLKKLRGIDLRHSVKLTRLPDLSGAANLESINLEHCSSLIEVTLHSLPKLTNVNLGHCSSLRSPDRIFDARPKFARETITPHKLETTAHELVFHHKLLLHHKLETINAHKLKTITRLRTLTRVRRTVNRGLVSVNFSSTRIMSLPSSIVSIKNLCELVLDNCKSLENLPSCVNRMDSLKYLQLADCSSLKTFPKLPRNIEELDVHGTAIKEVPSSSIEGRLNLRYIDLSACLSLKSLPTSIFELTSLLYLNLGGCFNLKKLPEISKPTKSLKTLGLEETGISVLPPSVKEFSNLRMLCIGNCKELRSLPELPSGLELLDASGCVSLKVVVPKSKKALTQEFLDYEHNTEDYKYSLFHDCFKLDQNARDNILIEFQIRVLGAAKQFVDNDDKDPGLPFAVGTSCPGNEVPKWFEYQSERSSIGIKLPLQWHNYNFLGFVLCVVGHSYSGTYENLNLSCQINFESNEGENHKFESNFAVGDPIVTLSNASNSSDVYMWPWLGDCRESLDAAKASFYFSSNLSSPFEELPSLIHDQMDAFEVKKCGIHMLYRSDLEKMNDQHLYEDPEPQHKKNKITDFCNCLIL